MLLPRMDRESREAGSRLRAVILTVLRCVFIFMSTPTHTSRVSPSDYKFIVGIFHTSDGTVNNGAIFELDLDRLIV